MNEFTGLIPEEPKQGDFKVGASPIIPQVVMPSSDWSKYFKLQKPQSKPFETFNCTAFGLTSDVATVIEYLIDSGTIKPAFLAFLQQYGYFDQDGHVNFSARALGAMSGTTSQGNRLGTVADTARLKGLAPDSLWPFGGSNTDEYYQNPPVQVYDTARRLLDFIDLPNEWNSDNSPQGRTNALTQVPLYVSVSTCQPWFGETSQVIPWCNVGNAVNHCPVELAVDTIGDSYFPYIKQLSSDYLIPWSLKIHVQQKEHVMIVYKQKGNPTLYFAVGNVLIPFATNYQDYLVDFAQATIVELPNLNSFKVSKLLVKT
jgi:hypothetical protein